MPLADQNSELIIAGIKVHLNRKTIKNIHLSVLPPDGRVRLSVPHITSEQAIRLAVINKLAWIKKQQADFANQPRQLTREMVRGESHYLWGKQYRLSIIETTGKFQVKVKGDDKIELSITENTSVENRLKLLNNLYRQEIKTSLEKLLPYWQKKLDVKPETIGIRKMKTKWGSCNIEAKRIWLNLELAKKPFECIEFVLVHELVHLIERHHNDRFKRIMDKNMPDWRERRNLLNSLPLAYEDWSY
ncbi:M48 family metallopeptidase [Psychromonas antarctica]|uniref:M48 family metallopeptidase n=1 Tax=Psychromonas antarctica TaxID=67573 RepID=UPI001EE882A4|nr:SprT family zinc-dependent metalloprotease [Psychromonas antarctica]MCG6200039.1 M48 family metallopeptidase [Psychromonas antarctica]